MKNTLSNSEAIEILSEKCSLSNIKIIETFNLRGLVGPHDIVEEELTIIQSDFGVFDASMITFNKPVILKNCTIEKFDIYGSYFLAGFTISNCVFKTEVPFMHASHGTKGDKILLIGNVFDKLVDFEDTCFKSSIEIRNNHFKEGTNLLTNMQLKVRFEDGSIIENNLGQLDISEKLTHEIWKKN